MKTNLDRFRSRPSLSYFDGIPDHANQILGPSFQRPRQSQIDKALHGSFNSADFLQQELQPFYRQWCRVVRLNGRLQQ